MFKPDPNRQFISTLVVDIDFYTKKKVTQEMYNSDDMAKEFLMQFANQVSHIFHTDLIKDLLAMCKNYDEFQILIFLRK